MADHTQIVRQMIDCYCHMDADALLALLHPQAKHTAPGSDFGVDMEGASRIVQYFKQNVFPSFHEVNFEVVHLYEDREQATVIVEWRSHLRPRTGRNYSNTGAFVVELREGKIYWVREYFDTEKAHRNV